MPLKTGTAGEMRLTSRDASQERSVGADRQSLEYAVASGSEVLLRIIRDADCDTPEHAHAEAQMSFFRRGSSAVFLTHTVTGRASKTSVAPGSVTYIAPHQPHRTHWHRGGEMLNIYLPPQFMEELADSVGSREGLRSLPYRQEGVLSAMSQSLLDEFDWSGQIAAEFADHARFLMAMRLLRIEELATSNKRSGQMSRKRLQPALDFLNEHSDVPVALAELAALCGSSTYHFARSFTAKIGCAPFAYQRTVRLQRAKDLLCELDDAVEAVGFAVGINSPSNFSRLFKRAYGVTPSEFRRMHLQGSARSSHLQSGRPR